MQMHYGDALEMHLRCIKASKHKPKLNLWCISNLKGCEISDHTELKSHDLAPTWQHEPNLETMEPLLAPVAA